MPAAVLISAAALLVKPLIPVKFNLEVSVLAIKSKPVAVTQEPLRQSKSPAADLVPVGVVL